MNTEANLTDRTPQAPASFARTSLFFCIAGGLCSFFGGVYLASLNAASSDSMFEAIANGVGWYCIGKGIFMMASPFQLRGAAFHLFRRN